MLNAAEVMEYFETAEIEQARLVLELAAGKMAARSYKAGERSRAAKKRWAKVDTPPKARRKRLALATSDVNAVEPEVGATL